MPEHQFAIALTFDDALPEHLDHALPILNQCGLPATFYMHLTAATFTLRQTAWRQAAEAGHEIGNHTIFHPATAAKAWVRPGNAIECYSLDRMALELETANAMLSALDGQAERTFAYPCSNSVLGRHGWPVRLLRRLGLQRTRWPGLVEQAGLDFGSTRISYESILEPYFVGARGGGLLLEQTPPPVSEFPRYRMLSAAIAGHSFQQMRAFIERSRGADTWAILQFHGVGGGHHMDCSLSDFRELIRWIADSHAPRVATVRDLAAGRAPTQVLRHSADLVGKTDI